MPGTARAQTVKPWFPPSTDSLTIWAARARALFATQANDTVSAANFKPYEIAGDMARRLLHSLGRESIAQAAAIEPVLDSLGLEVAVRVDPALPHFALVSVRNPTRTSAMAVAFVFWYRGPRLHQQGVLLASGADPALRVWFGGRDRRPYSLAILDRARDGSLGWVVLGLNAEGTLWNIVQSVDRAAGDGRGQGTFADVNGDGLPELVLWTRARLDSLFTLCSECPQPLEEAVLVERQEGFVPQDSRLLPTPLTTLTLFVRFLRENNRAAAARLLDDPKRLDQAFALGWGARRARGTWRVEYAEESENWPRWLAVRFQDEKRQLYIFHFVQKEGRWVIRDWTPVRPKPDSPPSAGTPAGGGSR